jgi:phosphatidylinositol-3,4,5-trisphosphate 3-phosphatase/dual-specificity protein phosphatase PTEN
MATRLKHLVSKKKKRFYENGFDLDLTYIKPNIVAMGFPSEKLEGIYRNHIDDVARFFDLRHNDHYKIYNLCSERKYDPSRFHQRVVEYGFEDHNAPPFELIRPFCEDVEDYLGKDEKNVAVIHCKAGKGRTGVMICAYMLHVHLFESTREALEFYGEARTSNKKGVTIPSQRRYVYYYGHYIRSGMIYRQTTLLLRGFVMHNPPNFSRGSCTPFFVVRQGLDKVKLYTSEIYPSAIGSSGDSRVFNMKLAAPVPICGDIVIEFYHVVHRFKKEKLFQFWINTFFVRCGTGEDEEKTITRSNSRGDGLVRKPTDQEFLISFERGDLDKANKDKKHYPNYFKLDMFWSPTDSQDEDGIDGAVQPKTTGMDLVNEEEVDDFNYSDTDPEDEWKDCPTTSV